MRAQIVVVVAVAASCVPEEAPPIAAIPGTTIRMSFARGSFYDAPFPSADLLVDGPDGQHVNLRKFPNPDNVDLVEQGLDLLEAEARGFGVSSGVFFSVSDPLGAVPSVRDTLKEDATVFLIDVDDASPTFGRKSPVRVSFDVDGGPFGAPNLLSLVPVQGYPLRKSTRYAAVVMRALGDADGKPLGASREMQQLKSFSVVDGLAVAAAPEFTNAMLALARTGVDTDEIAAMTAFTTDDPTARFHDVVRRSPTPRPAAFAAAEEFNSYCSFSSSIAMPVFQQGRPPYSSEGGAWSDDVDHEEDARVFVTVPRGPMPEGGFPVVVFVRTGGGGDRPLLDRGVRDANGDAVTGSGYAQELAQAGWAGLQIDGPHGGPRNVSDGDEQFLMFNVFNAAALRDNVRQAALETVLAAHVLDDVVIADACGQDLRFDAERMAVMGHSMGATIAPLALAAEPRFDAALLSGAGGSYLENLLHKQKPIDVKPVAHLLLNYTTRERELTAADPVLSLVQWALEPADPQVYAEQATIEPISGEPRHVLMLQGIVDHYIMPPIANALSLPLGLALHGEARDEASAELESLPSFNDERSILDLPPASSSLILVQHDEDGVEDGHEVAFQLAEPKAQVRCFLSTLVDEARPRIDCE